MTRLALLLVSLAVSALPLAAQSDSPRFEVASIKPNPATDGPTLLGVPDRGNVSALRYPTLWLIAYAYDVKHLARIKGSPDWLLSERFDIRGIPPADAQRDQIPLMVQTLLIDRFKLRAHWEMQDQSIYSLEMTRDDGRLGPNLKPSKHDCEAFLANGGRAHDADAPRDEQGRMLCGGGLTFGKALFVTTAGRPWSMIFTSIASAAETYGGLDRPLVDNTGLTGNYDMHLEFAPLGLRALRNSPTSDQAAPAVREAIQEQLGLKLVPKTAPWKVLVIDSIDRPTPD